MKKHLKWMVPAAVVVAVTLAVVMRPGRADDAQATPENGPPGAEANGRRAEASIGDVAVTLSEVGEIQPERIVLVKSKVSGKVRELFVEEGQDIAKGALLARIEPDMAQARTVANLKTSYGRARVTMERARQDYERDLELHSADLISDEQLQLSKDEYDIAMIEYRSALEQMELAEEDGVSMDLDGESAEFLDVVAPASGTIVSVDIEEGEIVTSGAVSYTAGTTLMTIADLSIMQIKAGVNEVDIGKIRNGQNVAIDVDAYPNITFEGAIGHIAPAARNEDGVKIFDVEIDITDNDPRLKPGMTANIEIQGDHSESVVTVPIEAVFRKNGGYVCYVFEDDADEPAEREVEVGVSNIERAEVVSGISEGETVALYDPELDEIEMTDEERRRQEMTRRAGRGR
ncbi:MAG: efflux RND transporter periplasmic adaptor subunit [Candidatus Eisenbacteria bacterium]|nr:efflux RND transporter periplasmic adaptor subunit [Candidatus Eisenbacteria bacterium]